MATVQLLLSDAGNRDALSELVDEHHTPIVADELRVADLYVVDEASFRRYREALERRKRDLDPVFCPVVLVRRDRSPASVRLPDIDDTTRPLAVNDVVRAPVERQAFFRTLSNLLARRSQTAELAGDLRARNAELRRFEKAVEHAGHAIFVTDAEGTIEYVNPAFEQMTGYSAEEAIGRNPRILKSGEQSEAFYEDLWGTISGGDIWTAEIVNERQSGERFVATQTISPIRDADGEVEGYVGIQEEITDRQLREQQLAVFHRILRHNLRNNGTTIVGRADLLAESLDDEDASDHLDTIRENMRSLLEISEKAHRTQRLLADSLDQSGTDRRLMTAIADVAETVSESRPVAAISIGDGPSEPRRVDTKVVPALREFVENAVIHSESATPRVAIGASSDGTTATITIADDGPGIPDRERRVIEEGTEKPLQHGSGLGLWFAYWLVSTVGGDIDISVDDGGTTVSVTVPVR